jgi:hypothetical protein
MVKSARSIRKGSGLASLVTADSNPEIKVQKPATTEKRRVNFFRKIESDTLELISEIAINGNYVALEELICNSHDAGAHDVYVDYDSKLGTLRVADDGRGMDEDEVNAFYRIGRSLKKPKLGPDGKPIIIRGPDGRPMIGKHGVATINIPFLCRSYDLTTQKNGEMGTGHEEFPPGVELDPNRPIPADFEPCPKENHGTEIVMSNLNFTPEYFQIPTLIDRLQWNLPISPDFQVYVNGKPIPFISVKDAKKFLFDQTGKKMGHVHGEIYFTNQPNAKHSGVYIKINGRTNGDPKALLDEVTRSGVGSWRSRLIAIVNADDLEPAILYNRSQLREDHPGVIELKQVLAEKFKEVRTDQARVGYRQVGQQLAERRDSMVKHVRTDLVRAGIFP